MPKSFLISAAISSKRFKGKFVSARKLIATCCTLALMSGRNFFNSFVVAINDSQSSQFVSKSLCSFLSRVAYPTRPATSLPLPQFFIVTPRLPLSIADKPAVLSAALFMARGLVRIFFGLPLPFL